MTHHTTENSKKTAGCVHFCQMWGHRLNTALSGFPQKSEKNKANLRDLITVTCLVFLLKIGFKSLILGPCDLEILWKTSKNNKAPLLCYFKLCAAFHAICEFEMELQSGNAQFGSKSAIFCSVWPWNLTDDLEKQEGTSSMLLQVCASFHSRLWIQNGVTVWKRSIRVKISDFFVPCDLEIWQMTLKSIWHLF